MRAPGTGARLSSQESHWERTLSPPDRPEPQGHLEPIRQADVPWRHKISHIRTRCSLCHSSWKLRSLPDTPWQRGEQQNGRMFPSSDQTRSCTHLDDPHLPHRHSQGGGSFGKTLSLYKGIASSLHTSAVGFICEPPLHHYPQHHLPT